MRDETTSNVPEDFVEAALFILIKDLRAQVAAGKEAVIKEALVRAKDNLSENRCWIWDESGECENKRENQVKQHHTIFNMLDDSE